MTKNIHTAAQRLIPVKDAAKRLGVCESSLKHWADNGKLPPDFITFNKYKYYKSKTISLFLKKQRSKKYRIQAKAHKKELANKFLIDKRAEFRVINNAVVSNKSYNEYYVAQFDKNFKFLGIFENRNQVVKYHFHKKGFRGNELIIKYIKFNVSLRSAMTNSNKWFGYFYKYIPKNKCRGMTFISHLISEIAWGEPKRPVKIEEDNSIYHFDSISEASRKLDMAYGKLYFWLNKNKYIPNTKIKVFTS